MKERQFNYIFGFCVIIKDIHLRLNGEALCPAAFIECLKYCYYLLERARVNLWARVWAWLIMSVLPTSQNLQAIGGYVPPKSLRRVYEEAGIYKNLDSLASLHKLSVSLKLSFMHILLTP